jgi:hypothetical protein
VPAADLGGQRAERERRDVGRGHGGTGGQLQAQAGWRAPRHPQRGRARGEVAAGPRRHAVTVSVAQPQLLEAREPRPLRAEARRGERGDGGRAVARRLGGEHPALDEHPFGGRARARRREAGEEGGDLFGVLALHLQLEGEGGHLALGDRVAAQARDRQVLDEVGDAVRRERDVRLPGPEHEAAADPPGQVGPEGADAVDLARLDLDHARPSGSRPSQVPVAP